jgi:hypothetical protein
MIRPVRVALLLLMLALPLLLQGASFPHTHFGAPDGFFNQEHDLTLLATVGAVASLDAAVPVVLLTLVATAVVVATRRCPTPTFVCTADSRAPPIR